MPFNNTRMSYLGSATKLVSVVAFSSLSSSAHRKNKDVKRPNRAEIFAFYYNKKIILWWRGDYHSLAGTLTTMDGRQLCFAINK